MEQQEDRLVGTIEIEPKVGKKRKRSLLPVRNMNPAKRKAIMEAIAAYGRVYQTVQRYNDGNFEIIKEQYLARRNPPVLATVEEIKSVHASVLRNACNKAWRQKKKKLEEEGRRSLERKKDEQEKEEELGVDVAGGEEPDKTSTRSDVMETNDDTSKRDTTVSGVQEAVDREESEEL